MSLNSGRFNFNKFSANWENEKRTLPTQIARTAENDFKQNFTAGGFINSYLEKWAGRKVADAGRALLVKTGRLKRSIRAIPGFNMKKIIIGTDVPYAKYHNEGTDKLPKRQFIGSSYALNQKVKALVESAVSRVFK